MPIGCSDAASTEPTRVRKRRSEPSTSIVASVMAPLVSVPVLSKTTVSMALARSKTSADLNNTPCCAPRADPTMIAVGVARPIAHGQAMMRTATALRMASVMSPPMTIHANKRDDGDSDDGRNEDSADLIREPLHRRLRRLRLLDELHDLREGCVAAEAGHLDLEATLLVDGRTEDVVTDPLVDGSGLTGQHRLVDRRCAGDDATVGWDLLAGPDDDQRTNGERIEVDHLLCVALLESGLFCAEFEEARDRMRSPALRSGLEVAAEEYEGGDHRRRLEEHGVAGEDRPHGIGPGGHGAHGHQRVHRRTQRHGLLPGRRMEPTSEPEHDDGGQDSLDNLGPPCIRTHHREDHHRDR